MIYVKTDKWTIEYDTLYGIDKRAGWSISIDRSYVVQFEKFLLVALCKAIKSQI